MALARAGTENQTPKIAGYRPFPVGFATEHKRKPYLKEEILDR